MKKLLFTALGLVSMNPVFAQKPGETVFFDSILHEIRIETSLQNWFDTLELDYETNRNAPETFPEIERLAEAVFFDGIRIDSVGFRHRGNFSNVINGGKRKKPFKIVFDSFLDRRFDGLKSINLINGTNDPSFVREALVYRLMRGAGQPAPRTAFCQLFINGELIGLYEMVENVDKVFLKMHFGGGANNDGNLFKTGRNSGVTMKWAGTEKQGYKDQGLELKSNNDLDDWSHYIRFMDVINNSPVDSLEKRLPSIFDVENYLRVLAIEKLVLSWDSYWGGGNNFYLYEHPDGRFRWIPWDFNETFQEPDGGLIDLITDPSFLVPTNVFGKRPLVKAIFSVEKWKNQYLEIVCEMLETGRFGLDSLAPPAVFWHGMIAPAYLADQNRLFPYPVFKNALTEKTSEVVIEPTSGIAIRVKLKGLFTFIKNRVGWAHEQLGFWEFDCEKPIFRSKSYDLQLSPNPVFDELTIKWTDAAAIDYSKIEIFNALGQPVFDGGWQQDFDRETRIGVEDLPGGVYFLVKKDGDGRRSVARFVR